MEIFLLYLWLKLDLIQSVLSSIFAFSALALAILYCMKSSDQSDLDFMLYVSKAAEDKILRQKGKVTSYTKPISKFLWAAGLSLFVAIIIPTQTQTAALVGAHYALKASESPEMQKVYTLMRLKANELLDKEIAEATKADKK